MERFIDTKVSKQGLQPHKSGCSRPKIVKQTSTARPGGDRASLAAEKGLLGKPKPCFAPSQGDSRVTTITVKMADGTPGKVRALLKADRPDGVYSAAERARLVLHATSSTKLRIRLYLNYTVEGNEHTEWEAITDFVPVSEGAPLALRVAPAVQSECLALALKVQRSIKAMIYMEIMQMQQRCCGTKQPRPEMDICLTKFWFRACKILPNCLHFDQTGGGRAPWVLTDAGHRAHPPNASQPPITCPCWAQTGLSQLQEAANQEMSEILSDLPTNKLVQKIRCKIPRWDEILFPFHETASHDSTPLSNVSISINMSKSKSDEAEEVSSIEERKANFINDEEEEAQDIFAHKYRNLIKSLSSMETVDEQDTVIFTVPTFKTRTVETEGDRINIDKIDIPNKNSNSPKNAKQKTSKKDRIDSQKQIANNAGLKDSVEHLNQVAELLTNDNSYATIENQSYLKSETGIFCPLELKMSRFDTTVKMPAVNSNSLLEPRNLHQLDRQMDSLAFVKEDTDVLQHCLDSNYYHDTQSYETFYDSVCDYDVYQIPVKQPENINIDWSLFSELTFYIETPFYAITLDDSTKKCDAIEFAKLGLVWVYNTCNHDHAYIHRPVYKKIRRGIVGLQLEEVSFKFHHPYLLQNFSEGRKPDTRRSFPRKGIDSIGQVDLEMFYFYYILGPKEPFILQIQESTYTSQKLSPSEFKSEINLAMAQYIHYDLDLSFPEITINISLGTTNSALSLSKLDKQEKHELYEDALQSSESSSDDSKRCRSSRNSESSSSECLPFESDRMVGKRKCSDDQSKKDGSQKRGITFEGGKMYFTFPSSSDQPENGEQDREEIIPNANTVKALINALKIKTNELMNKNQIENNYSDDDVFAEESTDNTKDTPKKKDNAATSWAEMSEVEYTVKEYRDFLLSTLCFRLLCSKSDVLLPTISKKRGILIDDVVCNVDAVYEGATHKYTSKVSMEMTDAERRLIEIPDGRKTKTQTNTEVVTHCRALEEDDDDTKEKSSQTKNIPVSNISDNVISMKNLNAHEKKTNRSISLFKDINNKQKYGLVEETKLSEVNNDINTSKDDKIAFKINNNRQDSGADIANPKKANCKDQDQDKLSNETLNIYKFSHIDHFNSTNERKINGKKINNIQKKPLNNSFKIDEDENAENNSGKAETMKHKYKNDSMASEKNLILTDNTNVAILSKSSLKIELELKLDDKQRNQDISFQFPASKKARKRAMKKRKNALVKKNNQIIENVRNINNATIQTAKENIPPLIVLEELEDKTDKGNILLSEFIDQKLTNKEANEQSLNRLLQNTTYEHEPKLNDNFMKNDAKSVLKEAKQDSNFDCSTMINKEPQAQENTTYSKSLQNCLERIPTMTKSVDENSYESTKALTNGCSSFVSSERQTNKDIIKKAIQNIPTDIYDATINDKSQESQVNEIVPNEKDEFKSILTKNETTKTAVVWSLPEPINSEVCNDLKTKEWPHLTPSEINMSCDSDKLKNISADVHSQYGLVISSVDSASSGKNQDMSTTGTILTDNVPLKQRTEDDTNKGSMKDLREYCKSGFKDLFFIDGNKSRDVSNDHMTDEVKVPDNDSHNNVNAASNPHLEVMSVKDASIGSTQKPTFKQLHIINKELNHTSADMQSQITFHDSFRNIINSKNSTDTNHHVNSTKNIDRSSDCVDETDFESETNSSSHQDVSLFDPLPDSEPTKEEKLWLLLSSSCQDDMYAVQKHLVCDLPFQFRNKGVIFLSNDLELGRTKLDTKDFLKYLWKVKSKYEGLIDKIESNNDNYQHIEPNLLVPLSFRNHYEEDIDELLGNLGIAFKQEELNEINVSELAQLQRLSKNTKYMLESSASAIMLPQGDLLKITGDSDLTMNEKEKSVLMKSFRRSTSRKELLHSSSCSDESTSTSLSSLDSFGLDYEQNKHFNLIDKDLSKEKRSYIFSLVDKVLLNRERHVKISAFYPSLYADPFKVVHEFVSKIKTCLRVKTLETKQLLEGLTCNGEDWKKAQKNKSKDVTLSSIEPSDNQSAELRRAKFKLMFEGGMSDGKFEIPNKIPNAEQTNGGLKTNEVTHVMKQEIKKLTPEDVQPNSSIYASTETKCKQNKNYQTAELDRIEIECKEYTMSVNNLSGPYSCLVARTNPQLTAEQLLQEHEWWTEGSEEYCGETIDIKTETFFGKTDAELFQYLIKDNTFEFRKDNLRSFSKSFIDEVLSPSRVDLNGIDSDSITIESKQKFEDFCLGLDIEKINDEFLENSNIFDDIYQEHFTEKIILKDNRVKQEVSEQYMQQLVTHKEESIQEMAAHLSSYPIHKVAHQVFEMTLDQDNDCLSKQDLRQQAGLSSLVHGLTPTCEPRHWPGALGHGRGLHTQIHHHLVHHHGDDDAKPENPNPVPTSTQGNDPPSKDNPSYDDYGGRRLEDGGRGPYYVNGGGGRHQSYGNQKGANRWQYSYDQSYQTPQNECHKGRVTVEDASVVFNESIEGSDGIFANSLFSEGMNDLTSHQVCPNSSKRQGALSNRGPNVNRVPNVQHGSMIDIQNNFVSTAASKSGTDFVSIFSDPMHMSSKSKAKSLQGTSNRKQKPAMNSAKRGNGELSFEEKALLKLKELRAKCFASQDNGPNTFSLEQQYLNDNLSQTTDSGFSDSSSDVDMSTFRHTCVEQQRNEYRPTDTLPDYERLGFTDSNVMQSSSLPLYYDAKGLRQIQFSSVTGHEYYNMDKFDLKMLKENIKCVHKTKDGINACKDGSKIKTLEKGRLHLLRKEMHEKLKKRELVQQTLKESVISSKIRDGSEKRSGTFVGQYQENDVIKKPTQTMLAKSFSGSIFPQALPYTQHQSDQYFMKKQMKTECKRKKNKYLDLTMNQQIESPIRVGFPKSLDYFNSRILTKDQPADPMHEEMYNYNSVNNPGVSKKSNNVKHRSSLNPCAEAFKSNLDKKTAFIPSIRNFPSFRDGSSNFTPYPSSSSFESSAGQIYNPDNCLTCPAPTIPYDNQFASSSATARCMATAGSTYKEEYLPDGAIAYI